jgi:pimeloyl-[acyl-carrier protein] methyl ester esterase
VATFLHYAAGMAPSPHSRNLPVLVLPGIDGTAPIRDGLMSALKRRGPADLFVYPHDPRLGYRELADLVTGAAPDGRFHILAESFGGPLAVEIAAGLGERVAGLALAVTFLRFRHASVLRGVAKAGKVDWAPLFLIEAVNLGRWSTPALREAVRETVSAVPGETLQARAVEALSVDKRETFAGLSCPTLYLHASEDRLFPAAYAREAKALRPEVEVEALEGPHMLLETHTDAAVAIIEAFLARCEAAPIRSRPQSS